MRRAVESSAHEDGLNAVKSADVEERTLKSVIAGFPSGSTHLATLHDNSEPIHAPIYDVHQLKSKLTFLLDFCQWEHRR